jgi:ribosomal-protein-alanine N-acetyltransferase
MNLGGIVRGAFQSAGVGYALDQALTGRGIATVALRMLIRYAFEELNLHRLQGETQVSNVPSHRVLDRCGFAHYGRAPDYARINGVWQTIDFCQLINQRHAALEAADSPLGVR